MAVVVVVVLPAPPRPPRLAAAGEFRMQEVVAVAPNRSYFVFESWENWMHSIERSHLLLCNMKRSTLGYIASKDHFFWKFTTFRQIS
jgi:hypothetical protein